MLISLEGKANRPVIKADGLRFFGLILLALAGVYFSLPLYDFLVGQMFGARL